jgi:hypothetical protein
VGAVAWLWWMMSLSCHQKAENEATRNAVGSLRVFPGRFV